VRVPKQGPFAAIFSDRYPPKQDVRWGTFAPTKKEGYPTYIHAMG